jgi:flagellar basal body-associated protein FliL
MTTFLFNEEQLPQENEPLSLKKKKSLVVLILIILGCVLVFCASIYASFLSNSVSQSALNASLVRIQAEQQ